MRCNNCGYYSNDSLDVSYCPRCGARLYSQGGGDGRAMSRPDVNQGSGSYNPADGYGPSHDGYYSSPGHSSTGGKRGNNSWVIIVLAVIIALAVVGAALYFGLAHQDEESMWAQCELTHEINDYKNYLDAYPNGEHSAEAQKMYTLLINEKTMWEQVQASNDEYQLRSFINNHPHSKFLPTAREMLDDVVWNNAIAGNTRQAFEAYVREFPGGRHIAEARSHLEEFRLAELTLDERDRVKATVQQFLVGLEQWDLSTMLSTCNIDMINFMGKHSASHADVREFFTSYQESGIDSISFSSLAVDVKKSLDVNHQAQYSANFTVTRRYWREGEGVTTSLMRGNAVVDAYFRFDELSLEKLQDN